MHTPGARARGGRFGGRRQRTGWAKYSDEDTPIHNAVTLCPLASSRFGVQVGKLTLHHPLQRPPPFTRTHPRYTHTYTSVFTRLRCPPQFVLVSDDEDDEFNKRQQEYMRPWEHGRGRTEDFDLSSDKGQKRLDGYKAKEKEEKGKGQKAFQKDVRKRAINANFADGSTRDEAYGGRGVADAGHIFAANNGGSPTIGNVYMQDARFNAQIHDQHDDLNCAMVGKKQTAIAYDESCKHGKLQEGRWGGVDPEDIRTQGKERYAAVGVLTKEQGGVDKRCKAVKNGTVTVDKYGKANMYDATREVLATEKEKDGGLAALLGSWSPFS